MEAKDDSTVVITWSGPYIFANLLGGKDIYPLPRHQLEGKYESDPSNFATGSEWTSAFIGAGPFRVQSWEPGVAIQATAIEDWFLSPPRIQRLDIRFISDPNAMLSNLLAGQIDLVVTPAIGLPQVLAARDTWAGTGGEGYLKTSSKGRSVAGTSQRRPSERTRRATANKSRSIYCIF